MLLEADVTSVSDDWIERLARPVLEGEGTSCSAPTPPPLRWDDQQLAARATRPARSSAAGCTSRSSARVALSARALELTRWPRRAGRRRANRSISGSSAGRRGGASPFAKSGSGPAASSRRRGPPTSRACWRQTVGGVFALMEREPSLWLEVQASAPESRELASPRAPLDGGPAVDVDRLLEAFQRGLRDLMPIWESVLAPETLGDVLSLEVAGRGIFHFPDEVWARVVYDAALGYHYSRHPPRAPPARARPALSRADRGLHFRHPWPGRGGRWRRLERVGAAFERQKPYLRDRWR